MATAREVKLPSKLWVGTHEFSLALVANDDPALEGAYGMTVLDDDTPSILVAGGIGTRKVLEVALHEITHAINWVHGIKNRTPEEQIATLHGLAWSQVLLDNPRFQRWLTYTLNRIRKERKDA